MTHGCFIVYKTLPQEQVTGYEHSFDILVKVRVGNAPPRHQPAASRCCQRHPPSHVQEPEQLLSACAGHRRGDRQPQRHAGGRRRCRVGAAAWRPARTVCHRRLPAGVFCFSHVSRHSEWLRTLSKGTMLLLLPAACEVDGGALSSELIAIVVRGQTGLQGPTARNQYIYFRPGST